ATLVISIDAPLRMLLDNENSRQFIPTKLLKKNKYGAYVNGIWMVVGLSGSIILIQSFVPGAAAILAQLNKLNSVCMPLRYLWVFVAYIALRKAGNKFHSEYQFSKHQGFAMTAGIWCFFVTAFCCITGMYSTDWFTFALNIITPIVLTLLGVILPIIKKREKVQEEA
ncbi:MAG: amino acid permease, partial [Longicatena sp.]